MFNFLTNKKIEKSTAGFTLVESLVAISILLVAISAPLTLVVKALQLSNYATSRMIAGFISQDAFEYIRNIKDTNALAQPSDPWLKNISSDCFYPNYCAVDTTVLPATISAFVKCNGGVSSCPALHRNLSNYAYNLNTGDPTTIFTRAIQIKNSEINPDTDKLVFVTVSWSISGFTKSITTQTSLLDWR